MIETGIPMVSVRNSFSGKLRGYLNQMDTGQSLLFTYKSDRFYLGEVYCSDSSISATVSLAAKACGIKVAMRDVDRNKRLWRVA